MLRFPRDQTVTAGAEVRLPCDADFDPFLTVEYKWLVEGNEINQVTPPSHSPFPSIPQCS